MTKGTLVVHLKWWVTPALYAAHYLPFARSTLENLVKRYGFGRPKFE